jgi:hypothetical protein
MFQLALGEDAICCFPSCLFWYFSMIFSKQKEFFGSMVKVCLFLWLLTARFSSPESLSEILQLELGEDTITCFPSCNYGDILTNFATLGPALGSSFKASCFFLLLIALLCWLESLSNTFQLECGDANRVWQGVISSRSCKQVSQMNCNAFESICAAIDVVMATQSPWNHAR